MPDSFAKPTEHFVRPDVRLYLDALLANPRPVFTDELVALIRNLPPGAMPSQDLPVGDLAVVRDLTMPAPGGALALRLFDPRASREAGPVVVYFHGGGMVVGSIDMFAGLAAEIARHLDLPVVSVEYRLAPEHPWPAAPDDAEAAARWIAENGAAFDRTFTGLVLCGDSAGGELTIITAMALRDRPAELPVVLQFPIYPVTDAHHDTASYNEFNEGYGLDQVGTRYFGEAYKPDRDHWRASPLRFDQTGMPPTMVLTASLDPLRDEGRAYAAKTAAAGVPTTFREASGTIHGFATFRKLIPSAVADLAAILDVAAAMLREARPV